MSESWIIKISIKPMASPRPRFARRGKYTQVYMPSKYQDHKEELKKYFPSLMLDGPVRVDAIFLFGMPKSWTKKKKAERYGKYHWQQRPDRDNLDKTVLDAMKEIIFHDDVQVCDGRIVKKWYSEDMVILKITKLED